MFFSSSFVFWRWRPCFPSDMFHFVVVRFIYLHFTASVLLYTVFGKAFPCFKIITNIPIFFQVCLWLLFKFLNHCYVWDLFCSEVWGKDPTLFSSRFHSLNNRFIHTYIYFFFFWYVGIIRIRNLYFGNLFFNPTCISILVIICPLPPYLIVNLWK